MNFWKKSNIKVAGLLLTGLTLFGTGSNNSQKEDNEPQTAKTDNIDIKPVVKKPTLNITYRTDTLEKRSLILLYNQNGNIIRHYRDNDSLYRMKMHLFVHEAWHTHNLNTGFKSKYKLSPQKYRKLLAHDEISANLASLNSLILEYTFADNKKEFLDSICAQNKYFSFYFNEVANGKINPLSTDSAMIEKDRTLRMNGIMKIWMERSYPAYSERQKRMLFRYLERNGIQKEQETAYKKVLHEMYNIGGIDFWKYAKSDIKLSNIAIIDDLTKINTFPKENKQLFAEIKKYAPMVEKIENDKQRAFAIQHLLIASEIKAEIQEKNYVVDDKITSILYNKISSRYAKDPSFYAFVRHSASNTRPLSLIKDKDTTSLDDFINIIYTFNDVDLKEKITDFAYNDVPCQPDKFWNISHSGNMCFAEWNDVHAAYIHTLPKIKILQTTQPKNMAEKYDQPHRSSKQYVDIPNFNEPILIALKPEQVQKLKNIYAEFHNLEETKEFSQDNIEQLRGLKQNKKKSTKTIMYANRKRRNSDGKTR